MLVDLILKLTSIPSVTGEERAVLEEIEKLLSERGLNVERLPVEENRWNIFAAVGTPRVVLTTHVDVVPALPEQFDPQVKDGKIFARGSCDAKGIAACMITAFFRMIDGGENNIGLLLVVGEELGGDGAIAASEALKGRGIDFLINGEPTESKLAVGHKGVVIFELNASGRSCHSGYPELGIDANQALLEVAYKLYQTDFGHSSVFGPATINFGLIEAGVAPNVVSSKAKLKGSIRVVASAEEQVEKIRSILPSNVSFVLIQIADPVVLKVLKGYETYLASYMTDIPNFAPLRAETLMFGPGSIHLAHTDHEYLDIEEAERGVDVYCNLVRQLTD